MSSRSATFLVIFIVAIVAFCFASVFASMTGPISILPNNTESGGILDNLSALTDDTSNEDESYGYEDYNDYSNDYSSDDSSSSDSQVETTTDDSSSSSSSDSSDSGSHESSSSSESEHVETTTDSSSSSSRDSSNIETTTG